MAHQLSDQDRAMADYIAEQSAQATMARLISAATNPDVAERVIDTWGGHVQRLVGRAVLRFLMYILLLALLFASFKLGVPDKIVEWLRSK